MCRSKPEISEVQNNYNSDDEYEFLGELTTSDLGAINNNGNGPWMTEVHVRGVPVKFKIDTGADVSVISEKDFLKVGKYPLQESDRKLYGPGKNELQVKGRFSATMSQMRKSCKQDIYVIKGLQQALLGRPAIEALRVVHKVDHVTSLENYTNSFPDCFRGSVN